MGIVVGQGGDRPPQQVHPVVPVHGGLARPAHRQVVLKTSTPANPFNGRVSREDVDRTPVGMGEPDRAACRRTSSITCCGGMLLVSMYLVNVVGQKMVGLAAEGIFGCTSAPCTSMKSSGALTDSMRVIV